MAVLEVRNVSKTFDGEEIIKGISMYLEQGEIVSLLGASGGGKTTLFNIIAGLSNPDEGSVWLKEEEVTGKPGNISYMLQKDLLLPYRTILDNVALPLLVRGMKKKEAREKAAAYFDQFGLAGTEKKYPAQLSGGMKQRILVAQALLGDPKLIILDEPSAGLDPKERVRFRNLIADLGRDAIVILSTHIVSDVEHIADRILMMKDGSIVFDGQAADIQGDLETFYLKTFGGEDEKYLFTV